MKKLLILKLLSLMVINQAMCTTKQAQEFGFGMGPVGWTVDLAEAFSLSKKSKTYDAEPLVKALHAGTNALDIINKLKEQDFKKSISNYQPQMAIQTANEALTVINSIPFIAYNLKPDIHAFYEKFTAFEGLLQKYKINLSVFLLPAEANEKLLELSAKLASVNKLKKEDFLKVIKQENLELELKDFMPNFDIYEAYINQDVQNSSVKKDPLADALSQSVNKEKAQKEINLFKTNRESFYNNLKKYQSPVSLSETKKRKK